MMGEYAVLIMLCIGAIGFCAYYAIMIAYIIFDVR